MLRLKLQQYLPLAVLKQHQDHTAVGVIVHAVATVPTACGIETILNTKIKVGAGKLQQYLPLAVLKLNYLSWYYLIIVVATVPTACGIETILNFSSAVLIY